LVSAAPNLVEGREFSSPQGIAFDYSVTPPAVYIVDTGNNRVLGWKSAAGLANGAKADIVVGQRDLFSTLPQGPAQPSSTLSSGLYNPVAVAVDTHGNLYVIDAGNNRILRYPTPFSQIGALLPVDLVIGQKSLSGSGNSQPNAGNPVPGSSTLFLSFKGVQAGLAIDAQGNLWATDPGNNRVLRFPAANLTANTVLPAADMVLGQCDFVSSLPPQPPNNIQTNKTGLGIPYGVAVDSAGRVYVADFYARVLEFQPPVQNCPSADRLLGIDPLVPQGQQQQPYPNNYTLGLADQNGHLTGAPESVFTSGTNLFVCDTPANRVVKYDTYSNWPAEKPTVPSPNSIGVIGQIDQVSGKPNQGLVQPNSSSLSAPMAGAFNKVTSEIWIVDSGNHRVLVFPQQPGGLYTSASVVLGQNSFSFNSPNLIEGRELSLNGQGGVVIDKNSNPPHLYIADTSNNRVLGFADARKVGTDSRVLLTQTADLVIGQPDLFHSLQNYAPSNAHASDALTPNPTGLIAPVGVAVDSNGNLYVADSGNGRILRFPAPFSQPAGTLPQANLVLGQGSFTSVIQDPSSSTMNTPYGLALFSASDSTGKQVLLAGDLAVSDLVHNRILIFHKPSGGDFTSGQSAAIVLGQADFISIAAGTGPSRLNGPHHIAADSSDRLYVCDTNNSRLLVFTNAPRSSNGASPALVVPGLGQPQGVTVSSMTGESWVTNTSYNQMLRLPEFTTLQGNPQATATLVSAVPVAVALDPFDNLVVAEGSNRLTFYFAQMYYRHEATYSAGVGGSPVNLAPGMLALLARYGSDFALTSSGNQSLPWPTTGLNDVQVLVNGVPAPVFRLDSAVVYFQVPMSAPGSGTADFVVLRPSTGQILAAATFGMQQAAPGLFTANQAGTGQAAAQNSDGTANGPANPAARGSVITLWLTGAGYIPGLPPDGTAPGAPIPTPVQPKVFLNGLSVPGANIQYSGVSPQFPGLWQLNVQIPDNVPPGNNISVLVTMNDYPSNYGGTSAIGGPGPDQQLTVPNGLVPTIAVKQ
jgi:uncharacterized protein (TIGR03437 family)